MLLTSFRIDLQKKLTRAQEILSNTESVAAKSRSEIKAITETMKEKTESVGSRDLTISALKIAQADLEKQLASRCSSQRLNICLLEVSIERSMYGTRRLPARRPLSSTRRRKRRTTRLLLQQGT